MRIDLVRSSHSVGRNLWVFEWCTKYRYKMMRKWEKVLQTCKPKSTMCREAGIPSQCALSSPGSPEFIRGRMSLINATSLEFSDYKNDCFGEANRDVEYCKKFTAIIRSYCLNHIAIFISCHDIITDSIHEYCHWVGVDYWAVMNIIPFSIFWRLYKCFFSNSNG